MKTLAVFLSILLGTFSFYASAEKIPPSYNRINLSSSAKADVENDLKVAELFAAYQDSSSAKVSDQVNRDIKWALKVAKEQGIESRTLEYTTQPMYEQLKSSYNRNKIVGWTATQALEIKSKDADLLGDVIGVLQQKLKTRSLRYQVSKQRRQEAIDELIDKAVANFRQRADKIAKGFGFNAFTLVRVNVNTGSNHPPPPAYRGEVMMMSADSRGKSASIESGTSELSVSVNGEIELK